MIGSTQGRWLAGWVPTITGHLSFSLVGGGVPGCVAANFAEQGGDLPPRFVAVLQKRVVRDMAFTFWPIGLFVPSIKAHYILCGVSSACDLPAIVNGRVELHEDKLGVLRGRVWVIPHHADRWQLEVAKDILGKIWKQIDAYSDGPTVSPPHAVSLSAALESNIERAHRSELAVVSCEFELFRTGELRLSIPEIANFTIDTAGGGTEERFLSLVADQIYYFIKDIAHRHYHHKASSDRMLPLSSASTRAHSVRWHMQMRSRAC